MKKQVLLMTMLAFMLQVHAADSQSASVGNDSITPQLNLRKKFYYAYNFDIYFHNDTKDRQRNNGWSFSLTPEFGYRINEKAQVGLRLGGSYYSMRESFIILDEKNVETEANLLVRSGSWEVAPYGRYRLKTIFLNRIGIWLELHGYTSMSFPQIIEGNPVGTDYDGLKHTITYGAQLSPLITFKFNEKSTFNFFFSILSLGYSGTTRTYKNALGETSREYSNDVILFSGKLSNLVSNHFTPGLYGIKFGIQKSF